MGVPVVTLAGNTFVRRSGASLLTAVGLPPSAGSGQGLIAQTENEYVRLAVELATDLPRLAALRRGLRGRMAASPLCDGRAFARKLEAAYRHMWQDWCQPTAPARRPRRTGRSGTGPGRGC
jgi:predicted O-linked N-acetylglucosamine transferase (SPINDLY family)